MVLCERHGVKTSIEEISNITGYDKQFGTTMLGLYHAAQKKGLSVVPARMKDGDLCKLKDYSIAFVDGRHFLVICGCNGDNVILQNPPDSPFTQSVETFSKRWNGEILLFGEDAKKLGSKTPLQTNKTSDGPNIHFNHTDHHFGLIEEGEVISHTFRFKNTGKSPLNVSVRSTCSCTVALTSGKTFAPGSAGEVTVEFNTQNKQGHTLNEIFVHTNDQNEPLIKLSVAATVSPGVKTVPDRIHLGELKPGEKVNRKILVLDTGTENFKVNDVIVPETIKARILPFEEKDNMRYIPIIFSFKSGETVGPFNENIEIITNRRKLNKATVHISGNIVGSAKIYPPRLYFGKQEQNTVSVREATIIPASQRKIKISKVESNSPYIVTKADPVTDTSKFKLVATLKAPDMITTIRDTISVYFEGNENSILSIPLYADIE
ncbi:MAG: DUF1573 domain-containing protein [Candidatus Latescibacteria bacterium]|nr:DUF1573 domain-containing protein [Candidatus Latescibacterota bacterium]